MTTDYYKNEPDNLILPNTFIVGAQKCGTTSMAYWLDQHSNFCVSRPKEARFLSFTPERGLEEYSNKFFGHYNGEEYVVEASPQCLFLPFMAQRIYNVAGESAKIIVMVRDPVERTYSAWAHFNRMRPGREIMSFPEAVRENIKHVNWRLFESEEEYIKNSDHKGGPYVTSYIELGLYMNQIRKYIEVFGEDKVSIHLLEDYWKAGKDTVYNEVLDFVGAGASAMKVDFEPKNIAPGQTEEISVHKDFPDEANILKECFYGDVMALENFMNRDLTFEWWLE